MIEKLKKEDINLAEWKFEWQQRNEQPMLMSDMFSRSLYTHLGKALQTPFYYDHLFTSSSKGYTKKAQKQQFVTTLQEKTKDHSYTEYILRRSVDFAADFDAVVSELLSKLPNTSSPQEFAALWTRFDDAFRAMIPWLFIPYYASEENIFTDRVKSGLEQYRAIIETHGSFNEILFVLLFPVKKAAFQKEQQEFFKLVSLARVNSEWRQDSAFLAQARQHAEKYGWMKTFLLLPLNPLTTQEILERIEEALSKNSITDFELQQRKQQAYSDLAQKILGEIKNKKLLQQITEARELGWALTAGVEECMRACARAGSFLQRVAQEVGLAYEDLRYLTSLEVIQLLKNAASADIQEILNRKVGFVLFSVNGVQKITTGSEGKALADWLDISLRTVDKNITELKGSPACTGVVRGHVRLGLTPKEAKVLVEGEILVCPMTSPEYVPAMQRSGAIVTDEGGLLCHAAIMSREFGKPCVIATKIATQVLKTGDLVEVDAEKGIVRILEKANGN